MLSVIISLLIVLLVSFAFGRVINRRIEECVPVVLMGTIVILYFFYLFDLLFIGRIVVYAGMLTLLIAAVVTALKSNKTVSVEPESKANNSFYQTVFQNLLTPGIVLLILLSLIFILYAANLKPSVWDELRLWAAMPKALHFSQSLQVGEGSLLYSTMQSYPPGMALLIYFFTAFSGAFSYGSIYAVYWIFMAALILPACGNLKWKQWYVFPPVFFLLLVLPVVLTINGSGASGDWNFFYASLYIDPILGCLMGYAFYQAVKDPFRDSFHFSSFLLTLFLLPALKNVGAMYAAVAFAAGIAAHFVCVSNRKKEEAGETGLNHSTAQKRTGAETMKQALLLIAPVLAIALSYFTWQFLIRTKGTGEFIDMKLSSFTGEKFLNVLKGMTTWGHIPFLYFALFFIIAGLFITFILKDISKKQALTGACGFLLAFILFFYGYTSHYGLMLSSIHRYTSTFSFAFLIYLLLRVVSSLKPKVEMAFEKTKEGSSHPKTLMQTIFPDRRLNAGRVLFIGLLLMIGAVLILFNSKNYQLENNSWESAQQLTLQAETSILKSLDAGSLPYDATHPAKCYLALGGDIRKQSQRHETYALAAIGSAVNIQNIWCDKLFNEAEDGVITSQSQMTEIWARNLLEGQYEYVIVAEADEDIVYAISQISAESSLVKVGEECLLKVVPADASYGISFMKQ